MTAAIAKTSNPRLPIHASRRAPLWSILTVWALHITFIGNILLVVRGTGESAGLGAWLGSLGGVALCGAAVLRLVTEAPALPKALKIWTLLSGIVVSGMILRTALEGIGHDPLYFALNVLPWAALCLLPLLGVPRVEGRVLAAFRLHLVLGVLLCGAILIANRDILTAESLTRSEGLGLKSAQYLLYPIQYLFFRYILESRLLRFVTLIGLAEILAIAVVAASRQPIGLLAFMVLLQLNILYRYEGKRGAGGSRWGKLRAAGAILAAAVCVVFVIRSEMTGGTQLLEERFTASQGQGSLAQNARWDEVHLLLEQFRPVDYLSGRGVLGRFNNFAAPKQDSLHIGYFRCLLKGGVPLVLLVILGPGLVAIRLFLKTQDPSLLAAAGMCIYFVAKNATGNIILPFPFFYIVAICFGECLNGRSRTDLPGTGKREAEG